MNKYTESEWSSSVLITIDTQNDFTLIGAPAEIQGTHDVLPQMKELLAAFRAASQPIIHVIRIYEESGANADICRKEMIENGLRIVAPSSLGAELVSDIQPADSPALDAEKLLAGEFQQIGANEWVMYKPRWGAFYKTDLEPFAREKGITTMVFCGCNFPNCPRTSIYEASERDFKVVLAVDAVSGIYEKGIAEMHNIGVNVLETAIIVEMLKAASPE